jgi:hypothetical protein
MSLLGYLKGESPSIFASIPHALQGKGHYGEYLTEYALNHKNIPGRLVTYTNVLVPSTGATSTSEIDILMLHEKGIYLFESKNYSGWIFGSEAQREWTVSYQGGRKECFYNPVKQNATHVKALAKWLGMSADIFHSYIVFSERCELKKVPENTEAFRILRRHHLVRDLKKDLAGKEIIFDKEAFNGIKQKLDALSDTSTKAAMKEHVEEVKKVVKKSKK